MNAISSVLLKPLRPGLLARAKRLPQYLVEADHDGLRKECRFIIQRTQGRGPLSVFIHRSRSSRAAYLHLARSYYLCGEWELAQQLLGEWLAGSPHDADARYLAADAARVAGNYTLARQHLLELYPNSKRRKTWLYMAQLVRSADDWQQMQTCYRHARELGKAPAFHSELSDYLAMGAQRGGDYSSAFCVWRAAWQQLGNSFRQPRRSQRRTVFPEQHAAAALNAVREALQHAGITSFLISGTLLGCIREGRLLSHDNDIDIGVWDDVEPDTLARVLGAQGVFHLMPSRHQGCLRVRHVSGIAIDVFTHYRDNTSFWHGGVKVRWHNSPFSLAPIDFLGSTYLIPADHDTYLTENYGDWRKPITSFDSTLDTPNAEILCEKELALHAYRHGGVALRRGDLATFQRYRALLGRLGEPDVLG